MTDQITLLPSVAVFVAVYNGMRWLPVQIDSILAQESVSLTIFVSVDASTDGTEIWFNELAERDARIVLLPHGRRFGGAAKNFFRLISEVDFLDYDYVSFADQDDIWFCDKLSHGIDQIRLNDADAYSGNVIAFWIDGREKLLNKAQPQRELDYLFEAAGPGCSYIFTQQALCVVKKYLHEYPALNDFVLHDWLAYAVLRHNGYRWFIDPEPKMMYRQHESNQVGANSSIKGVMYRLNYVMSGRVFESISLLVNTLGVSPIDVTTRFGLLQLACKYRKLRRRTSEQLITLVCLILYALKRPS